jgi:hypothetical protein
MYALVLIAVPARKANPPTGCIVERFAPPIGGAMRRPLSGLYSP